jgi:hypothetical protein
MFSMTSLQVQAGEPVSRKPGHYVIWASNDGQKCKAAVTLVNGLPRQDVIQAAYDKRPGFLSWEPLSALELGQSISYISLPLSDGTAKYVLLSSGSLSNVIVDSLYFAESLPTNREELGRVWAHEVISPFFTQAKFEGLQKAYGDDWQDWYISSHFIAVFGRDQPLFFANDFRIRDHSTRILVFQVDGDGARKDLCMLRRICSCAKACMKPLHTKREQAELRPSAEFCRRSETGALSNFPVNADARDVPAHASDRAARAGYRER